MSEQLIAEDSLLLTTSPLLLILALAVLCALGWYAARRYRNTNDFARSVKLYGILYIPAAVLLWLIGVPGLVIGGGLVIGFVAAALASNYYFYHS